MRRDDRTRGGYIAGTLLLGVPMLDIVLGGAFGWVHAVLGSVGLAFLVPTLLGKEA